MITNTYRQSASRILVCSIVLAGSWLALPFTGAAKEPATSAINVARQLNEAFVQVAETVSPSVVVIEVIQKASSPEDEGEHPFLEMFPPELRRQLEEYLEKQREQGNRRTPERSVGRGSGFIIRKDGYILTNTHVVEDAETIKIHLHDGREFQTTNVWTDPQSDIAVVKIDAQNLPTAKLGDSSKTRVGEFAIAIGAPYVLDYSVTFGHVSAKGRSQVIPGWMGNSLGARMDQDFIQTDASINPGNSGGPLVNIEGEVIGINTVIRGIGTGIGFAVPSNLAREVSDQLITEGKFTRAWLGIQILSLRESADREIFKGIENGIIVQAIQSDGPAIKSKLKPFDLITSVEGIKVGTALDLRHAVRSKKVGSTLTLDVVRHEGENKLKKLKIPVKTEAWPEQAKVTRREPKPKLVSRPDELGAVIEPLNKETAERFNVSLTEGVIVTKVSSDSLAERAELQPGDIITEVDEKPVRTAKQFNEALKAAKPEGAVLNIIRHGTLRTQILKDGD